MEYLLSIHVSEFTYLAPVANLYPHITEKYQNVCRAVILI
jgi:hypothetical protein